MEFLNKPNAQRRKFLSSGWEKAVRLLTGSSPEPPAGDDDSPPVFLTRDGKLVSLTDNYKPRFRAEKATGKQIIHWIKPNKP